MTMTELSKLSISEEFTKYLEIGKAEELVSKLMTELEQTQTLLDLAKQHRVEIIKGNIRYDFNYNELIISHSQEWLEFIKTNKVDKRKKYEGKTCLDLLTKSLSEDLNQNIEINEIISYGYESYAYKIRFKVKGIDTQYSLTIPMISKLSIQNFDIISHGKLGIAIDKENIIEVFETSYEFKFIAEALKKNIDEMKMK